MKGDIQSHRLLRSILPGLILFLALAPSVVLAGSARIMLVGDSDTAGFGGFVGYRYDLWFMLDTAGHDVDFVGRRLFPTSGVTAELYPMYDDLDKHHEGRFGATLSQIISSAANMVETSDPDIVLLLHSEDVCMFGNGAVGTAQNKFFQIIDSMRAVNNNLIFLLGQSYPYEFPQCASNLTPIIADYNNQIAAVAAARNTAASPVLVVDHFNGFNQSTMYDGGQGHANRQGEMFIASNWFDTLDGLLPLEDTGGFEINSGLNDAWFNPVTPGQGFFITVFPDSQLMFLAWFTYDTERPPGGVQANLGEPGHRWLTAFGSYANNVAELDIEVTSGGVFDSANPAPSQVSDGNITVEFDGCNAATVSYDIPSANVAGEIPIERIALDNVAVCEALTQ